MRANRTHLGTFCVPTRGFEVRGQHQLPLIPNRLLNSKKHYSILKNTMKEYLIINILKIYLFFV